MLIWQKKTIKSNIFHFSKRLYRVEQSRKHLEKLVLSRADRDSIKICELKVTVKLFVIQASKVLRLQR